nr:hypothetical protein ISGA_3113 [Gordonia sp. NB41Y]
MRSLGLVGLMVAAMLAAVAGGNGAALAAPQATPGTTTPSTSTPGTSTPGTSTPGTSTPGTNGLGALGGISIPETGIPELDTILNKLSGAGSSELGPQAGESSQMIVVTAPKASDQTATLTAFQKEDNGTWRPVFGPTKAFLGELGMGQPQDNVYRTPEGTFALDQAFGRLADPGTKMPYFKTDTQDWWDSDTSSPTYNTHVRQAQSPGGDSENLYNSGAAYDYAVNIAHNPQRIPGKASAIFLHASTGEPTMGCVAIDKDILRQILVWLDPAKNPRITIGVNQPAPTGQAQATTPEGGTAPSTTTPTTPGTTTPGTTTPGTTTPGTGLGDSNALTQLLNQLVGVLPALLGVGG